MTTLQNLGVLKYRDKDGNWKPLPVVVQDADGGVSTISGKGAPTSATQGKVNQLYRDEDTQRLYICTATDGGGYTWTAVVSDTENAVTYTAQTLTEEQKTQARANIGAGTSNFSGSFNDLTEQPNIPAATVIDTTLSKSGQAADAKAAGDAIEKKIDAPQVAQVGEVLTVEEVGEDGKPIKWKTQVVDVDGVLKYTEQELTTEEQAQARKNIGAQQTDFIINVKENEDGVVAADKTLVEIKTAYESKVNMWAVFYGNRYIFQGYLRITDSYLFVCVMDNVVTKYGSISMIEFNSNGNISIHGMEFTALYKMEQIIVGNGGAISGVPLGQNPVPENATYVTVPKASGLKAGKVLTTTGENGVLAMEWKDINFPVTITSTTTDGVTTYTADKTFAEIKAAYDSGANVYALYNEYISYLFYFENSAVWFRNFDAYTDYIAIYINSYNGIDTIEVERLKYLPVVSFETLRDYLNKSYPPIIMSLSDSTAPNGGGVLFYSSGMSSSKINYSLLTNSGELYNIKYDRRYGNISTSKVISPIPSPATAQVGQIVKVKSVDESGKIKETETVDMPTQKTLKWITVHSSDLAETKRELIISTDTDGKSIADYNPVGLTLIISTPADATQTDNNGAPWVYPSATKEDNSIRVTGTIAGWKTTARDSVFAFYGGSSAMTCTGNVNIQLATYKIDGYALDGVTAILNGNANHFPVGTHVEVSILCEVPDANVMPA